MQTEGCGTVAKEYKIAIQGQPTKYSDHGRTINVYFAEPESGAGEHTGILLLIAGYGGHAMSNVYQKMRRTFADQYDLMVLQCDYLGYQYMQNDQHLTVTESMLRRVLSSEEIHVLQKDYETHRHLLSGKILSDYISLGESASDFNEMGLWQAMDNLMAVKVLVDIMKENDIQYCTNRVYIYGQSHGAYLAYLCNYLAPGLFTGLIDNSAYLIPYFLKHDREVTKVGEVVTLKKRYHYLIADQEVDIESYDLRTLYADYTNQAKIIVYHGEDDDMIPFYEKKEFLDRLQNVSLHVVTKESVDGVKFKSAGHSLGADLLAVFHEAIKELEMQMEQLPVEKEYLEKFVNHSFQTTRYFYEVDWKSGIPILYCTKREDLIS